MIHHAQTTYLHNRICYIVKATRENLPENDNWRLTVFKPGSEGAGVIINRWVPEHWDLEGVLEEGVSILQTVLFNETTWSYCCPKCSDTQHLRVVVQAWVDLEQEGGEGQFQTVESGGDHEWDAGSRMHCTKCGYGAPAANFQTGDCDA
jgi:predicted RNA-binding Zn-ribbon protein involved in translation (DUF1610 family)